MTVKGLLSGREGKIYFVQAGDTVATAAALLSSNNIGALPVRDSEGKLIGILSERDIVRGFGREGERVKSRRTRDLMTKDVATCTRETSIDEVLGIMSRRHIRHLPVLENARVIGMVSLRDVMEAMLQKTELERNVLRDLAIVSS